MGKISESILWGLGSEQLEKCNLVRDGQHGFLMWVLTNLGFLEGIAAMGGMDLDWMACTCALVLKWQTGMQVQSSSSFH